MTMIDAAEKARRLERLRGLIALKGLAGAVLFAAPRGLGPATQTAGTVQYFTGWSVMWTPVATVIPPKGRPTVIVPGKNEERLMRHRCGDQFDIEQLLGRSWPQAIDETARQFGMVGRIGLAGGREMTFGQFPGFGGDGPGFLGIDAELATLRMQKSEAELALHRQAVAISEAMVERAVDAVRRRVSPARIMAEVEFEGRLHGADISRLWLSTGPNPPVTFFEMFELPESLDRGDRVQLGTMVTCEGYYAQTLRILTLGEPSPHLLAVDRALRDMQDAAASAFRAGAPLTGVVDRLEDAIDRFCPYTRQTDPFRFQSCHGLGLDYADPGMAPALSPARDRSLDHTKPLITENMVMEIHPNFTLPGLGHVCLGDVAVATPSGGEWLGRLPRTILDVH